MTRQPSFFVALLSALRITVVGARWLFASAVLLLVTTVTLYVGFTNAGQSLAPADVTHVAVVSMLVLLFGWLGFSAGGRALLQKSAQHRTVMPGSVRVLKLLFASAGLAVGIWIILIVLSLIIGGPDWVSMMFLPWVLALLTLLCLPFAYKWLK